MPKRTVTVDVYNWQTPAEGRPGRFDFHTATKGDVIDVSDAEAKRGEELGGLAGEDEAVAGPTPSTAYPQEETALVAGITQPAAEGGEEGLDLSKLLVGPNASTSMEGGPAASTVTDEELAGMSATELVAFLNQNPHELDRIDEIEGSRSQPRKVVTTAIENHRNASTSA